MSNNIPKSKPNNECKTILCKIGKGVKDPTIIVSIIFLAIAAIFTAVTTEQSVTTVNPILEENVFDPLCVGEHNLEFERQSFCSKWSWVESMGVSANIDDIHTNDSHARILFLKIDTSNIPSSTFLTTTSILKSDLTLKTRYEPALNGEVTPIPFYTVNQFCTNTNWNEKTEDADLPCIQNNMYPDGKYSTFEPLNPKWIDDVKFDLKSHITKAKNEGNPVFTELIQFYPIELSNNHFFNATTKDCIMKKSSKTLNYLTLDSCLGFNRISVYGNENPSEGVRPQLVLEYTTKPNPIALILIGITSSSIPIFGGVVKAQYQAINDKRKNQKKLERDHATKMNTICETLKQEVIAISYGFLGKDSKGNDTDKFPKMKKFEFVNPKTNKLIFKIDLDEEISFVKSPKDAFQGIVNSGSFEEFENSNQTAITELYEYVKAYEEYLEKTEKLVHELQIKSNDDTFENVSNAYQEIIVKNLTYLSSKRTEILSKTNNVLKMIEEQKSKFPIEQEIE